MFTFHPKSLASLVAAALAAVVGPAFVNPAAAVAGVGPSGIKRRNNDFSNQAGYAASETFVTVRHTPIMAATLACLLDHFDRGATSWMLITEVESALQDRHPGSGVRAALDRLTGISVVNGDVALDVLDVADHPTETWTNRRTGRVFKRQMVRLTPAGYRWATDYVRNMHKGKHDRAALQQRTTAARRSMLRATPLTH
jgi:hypothetical protein